MPDIDFEQGGNTPEPSTGKASIESFAHATVKEAQELDLSDLAKRISSQEGVLERLDDLEEDPNYFYDKKGQIKTLRGRLI